jgi:proteic killer suppression protein
MPYIASMIRSFRSNALNRYWTRGQDKALRPEWRKKVKLILSRLDIIGRPQEMDIPGFGFHPLKGDQRGRFAVWVSHNWRVTFGWDGTHAIEVDLEDYHGR